MFAGQPDRVARSFATDKVGSARGRNGGGTATTGDGSESPCAASSSPGSACMSGPHAGDRIDREVPGGKLAVAGVLVAADPVLDLGVRAVAALQGGELA